MISSTLIRHIDRYATRLRDDDELLALARAGQVHASTVALYLANIRYLVRHTPIHLRAASVAARARGRDDLARHFEYKLGEEAGHDLWADDDLRRMHAHFGVTADEQPLPSMQALIDFIAQLVEGDPESYLAYILFAEYFTVALGPVWIDALTRNCGIPADALTVIGHHVELDVRHAREGSAEIDSLVARDDGATRLNAALTATTVCFDRFLAELAQANHIWKSTTRTSSSASS